MLRPSSKESPRVNALLAFGQILVSVALMASILLQARGAGLSAAFGGDSSVYRSRRGIEKRLFQFTLVLSALFVIFSIATYLLSQTGTSS
jgi:preprotein translocase subunit SecG